MSAILNNKSVLKVAAFMLVFACVFGFACRCVFADSSSIVQIPVTSSVPSASDVISNGSLCYSYTDSSSSSVISRSYYYLADTVSYSFAFYDNNYVRFIVCCRSPFRYYYCVSYSDSSSSSLNFGDVSYLYNDFYYGNVDTISRSYTVNFPSYIFPSLDDGFAAVRDYIDNGGSSTGEPFSLNSYPLPAGNVMYISTENDSDVIDLRTTFSQYSTLFQNSWSNITQTITRGASLPSSGTTFPLTGGFSVDWIKDKSNTNLLGQTKSGYYNFTSGANYTVLYNPLYQQYGQGDNYDLNGTIYVSADNVTDFKIYPLSGSVVVGEGLVSSSITDYDNVISPERDESGNVIIGSDGQPSTVNENGVAQVPVTGGTSSLPSSASIADILRDLVSSVSGLFTTTYDAIRGLIAAGSDWFIAVRGMYSWLPSDVTATVGNALKVSFVLGVIAVLL